jgi:hypothetical protein
MTTPREEPSAVAADAASSASGAVAKAGGGSEEETLVCPEGERFAVQRWVELTDPETPWWAMSTGVGLSLQLSEIQQLSTALQEGKVVSGALEALLKEAHGTFVSEGRYAGNSFPEIKERLRGALKVKDATELLPGGAALAAVEAAQELLREVNLLDRLITDLAAKSKTAVSLDDFLRLDEQVTLLDAELAFIGYSREWRSKAAAAAREGHCSRGEGLADAIRGALAQAGTQDPNSFEAYVPLLSFVPDGEVALFGKMLERESAEDRVAEWNGGGELLDELGDAEVVLRLDRIEARDLDAAAEQARDSLARRLSLWDLQEVAYELGKNLLIRNLDDAGHAAERRPTRSGWLKRPAGLKDYEAARKESGDDISIRRITDALDQLAQARSGSHGASLADLWTVSETLFGGLAADKSFEVSDQLAGVAEYLYVRDLLQWLGSKLDPEKIDMEGLEQSGTEGEWTLRCLRWRAKSLPQKLVDADMPLVWLRFQQVLRWDEIPQNLKQKCFLGIELEAVARRVAAVGNRAYLVRNLFLHQGNPERAAAMAVTLPIFAGVMRAVVGHINLNAGKARLPLVESQLARLNVQHVAAAYFATPKSGPRPLEEFVTLK